MLLVQKPEAACANLVVESLRNRMVGALAGFKTAGIMSLVDLALLKPPTPPKNAALMISEVVLGHTSQRMLRRGTQDSSREHGRVESGYSARAALGGAATLFHVGQRH
ncbi:hypothetical protein X797_007794 [Metarhizium robertsii]|uniref:Uncharacterized protein n=1 Tax=Metarhizium robertsii TaxID=568076 RepID=A0A0A1US22_9HYPO|nr:hypothetical protein X797_007794 [Metarhizium robertsii]